MASVRETKRVLVEVNRIVASIDRLYVALCWVESSIVYVTQFGAFTVLGSVLGRFVGEFKVGWVAVAGGAALYLGYRALMLAIANVLGPRTRLFEISLTNKMDELVVTKIVSLDLGRLLDPAFAELQGLARNRGVGAIERLWRAELKLAGAAVALGAGVVVLFTLDPLIGVLALLSAAPKIARDWYVEAKRRTLDEAEIVTQRQRREAENALSAPRSALRSRLLQLNRPYLKHFKALTEDLRTNALVLARFDRNWNLVIGISELAILAALLAYFASGFYAGKYSYTQVGAIIGSMSVLVTAMHQFGSSLARVEHGRRDYAYFSRLMAEEPIVDETGTTDIVLSRAPAIVLTGVSFAYPSSRTPVLRDFSVSIEAGEKVALIGRNSAGKTTVLRLIAKTYLPDAGTITLAGREIRTIRQESLLDHMLMVPQEFDIPGMELSRSLTGVVADEVDQNRLAQALKFAAADDIVSSSPEGIRTWVGEQWKGGRGFSTGQLQRLALAGAFYRFLDPRMVLGLFDEPMAHCDVETRSEFYRSIGREPAFADKTILMSLHDPLYLHYFNRVLFIENGRLVQDVRGAQDISRFKNDVVSALAGDL